MKVTFPHMGNLWIALKALFEKLGHEVITPPPITKKTIDLGVRYSPEFACLPLKVNVGNFIEGLENGADTVIMMGGSGPCRFGYYGQVEREILNDLGYSFNIIIVDPPEGDWKNFLRTLGPLGNNCNWKEVVNALLLAWSKIKALDHIHRAFLKSQHYESSTACSCYEDIIKKIDIAMDRKELRKITLQGAGELMLLTETEHVEQIKIGIVGEVFMMWEPYVNLDLEKTLGSMGVEVVRSAYISDWINENILYNPSCILRKMRFKRAAKPYLSSFVGGHGWESVGETILFAERKFDGIIHVLPFTCMPEIIAQSILGSVSRDYKIPILTLSLDEHSGQAGFLTRVEAFIDMVREKKRAIV
ncbi:MAG: CoA protein activase [Bacillota bacterium]|nr:CoA protein activase [Bacillota bacterium]